MEKKAQLQHLNILIAERSAQVRDSMLAMLREQGIQYCRGAQDLKRMKTAILEKPLDLIVASDDLDPDVFKLMRQLRMNQIGANPFTVLTMMVEPSSKRSFQLAIICGADDILIKPVAPIKIVSRAKYIAFNRLPFTATKDYVGPARKQLNLNERTPIIQVLNTLRDKMEGKKYTLESLRDAVISCMNVVRSAQLDSHTLRLEYTCGLIIKAYECRKVGPEVKGYLAEVSDSLREAVIIANQIDQPDLARVCSAFANQIEDMESNYRDPAQQRLDLIGKLARAFKLARSQSLIAS